MAGNEGFAECFYSAPDGLRLHARIYGDTTSRGEPVVCLPGLTRNSRDFHELALYLSADAGGRRRVVAFDYRGRGQSARDPDWKNYHITVEAEDVVAGLIAIGIDRASFIGTSRGGLIIHALAVLRPRLIGAVVLNDIGPVLEGEGLAHIRSYLENAPKPRNFKDAVAIEKAAHSAAFPALTGADWEGWARALYREGEWGPVRDFDPALLELIRTIDVAGPLPQLWPQFEALARVPVLAIRGQNSRLLAAATLAEMRRRHPACETLTVEGQGHAPLLGTGTLPQTIGDFLDRAG